MGTADAEGTKRRGKQVVGHSFGGAEGELLGRFRIRPGERRDGVRDVIEDTASAIREGESGRRGHDSPADTVEER
jgi:hypothetical protein